MSRILKGDDLGPRRPEHRKIAGQVDHVVGPSHEWERKLLVAKTKGKGRAGCRRTVTVGGAVSRNGQRSGQSRVRSARDRDCTQRGQLLLCIRPATSGARRECIHQYAHHDQPDRVQVARSWRFAAVGPLPTGPPVTAILPRSMPPSPSSRSRPPINPLGISGSAQTALTTTAEVVSRGAGPGYPEGPGDENAGVERHQEERRAEKGQTARVVGGGRARRLFNRGGRLERCRFRRRPRHERRL